MSCGWLGDSYVHRYKTCGSNRVSEALSDKSGSIESFNYFIPLALCQRFLINSVRASRFILEETGRHGGRPLRVFAVLCRGGRLCPPFVLSRFSLFEIPSLPQQIF